MPTAKLTEEKRIPDVDMDIREISYTIMKDEGRNDVFQTIYLPGQLHVPNSR